MTERRGSRFVLEILFLVALATALTLARLDPLEIAGVMLLGWVIVAALEWAAWRNEPHYGSGLPPRYYVPAVNLPPAQPLEQVQQGYPDGTGEEAPTWIASAALRAELLGEWPVAAPVAESETDEPEPEVERAAEPEPLPEPVAVALPAASAPEAEAAQPDPWTVAALPVAPLGELDPAPEPETEPDPEPEPELEPAAVVAATEPEPDPEPEPTIDAVLARSARGVARYSLDPLAEPVPRKRFRRGAEEQAPAVEVPARPEGARALPGRSKRQD
jgi:hypothetical protein